MCNKKTDELLHLCSMNLMNFFGGDARNIDFISELGDYHSDVWVIQTVDIGNTGRL